MKSTSQTTDCIACGNKDVFLTPMCFMDEWAQFPICQSCATYLERVLGDPSFGQALLQFHGLPDVRNSSQTGGPLSYCGPDEVFPPDFAARMADFDLYCSFLGRRIRELGSAES